jgi:hypothetical protein
VGGRNVTRITACFSRDFLELKQNPTQLRRSVWDVRFGSIADVKGLPIRGPKDAKTGHDR